MHPTLTRHRLARRPEAPELPRSPGAYSRLQARVHAALLDYELAGGVPTWESPRHVARALALTAPRRRRALARSLQRLLELSASPADRLSAVPVCRVQVLEAAPALHAITQRLRAPAPVHARGMAMLTRLITDGAGACYVRGEPGSLAATLAGIAPWLEVED